MENENTWSKDLRETSLDVLSKGRCMEPCHVKHYRDDDRYGTVSVVKGISNCGWDVITTNGDVEHFDTVEELVSAGWVVD